MFVILLLLGFVSSCRAQFSTNINFDPDDGLVYALLLIFFLVNFCTPVFKWVYLNLIRKYVEKANEELKKVSKRLSDRISDAGRQASERIRV